jgi:hyperosmotically inducible periplasmic protein
MNMHKSFTALTAILFLVVGLTACQTPAGRSTGRVVDDSTITAQAKAKLLADTDLNGLGISVETFDGDVTLTGAVQTVDQKTHAEEIVRSVSGVRSVNNLLKIK